MKPSIRVIVAVTLLVAIVLVGKLALAATSTIADVGTHTPLIKIEKNENPQNLMVVYTKLDEKTCAFAEGPVLDEYWLMDGTKYKKVNSLIKSGIQKRFELDKNEFAKGGKFLVHLRDFHELKSDLGDQPTFEVHASKVKDGCKAVVEMKLGPSDSGRTIAIDSIYADSSKKILPPFRKLNSLTLIGRDVATGAAVRRTYSSN